jgi:hypothetical protein
LKIYSKFGQTHHVTQQSVAATSLLSTPEQGKKLKAAEAATTLLSSPPPTKQTEVVRATMPSSFPPAQSKKSEMESGALGARSAKLVVLKEENKEDSFEEHSFSEDSSSQRMKNLHRKVTMLLWWQKIHRKRPKRLIMAPLLPRMTVVS